MKRSKLIKKSEFAEAEIKDMKKMHAIEIITLKKNARKAQIEFFK